MWRQEIAHKVEFRVCLFFFANTLRSLPLLPLQLLLFLWELWKYIVRVYCAGQTLALLIKGGVDFSRKTLSQTVWPQLYSPVLTAAKSVLVVLVHRSVFPDPLTGAVSLAGDVPFDVRFRNFGVQLHWEASTSVRDYYFSLSPCHALYPFNSPLHSLSHSVS